MTEVIIISKAYTNNVMVTLSTVDFLELDHFSREYAGRKRLLTIVIFIPEVFIINC